MQIIEIKTDELIPYANNPRNNDAAVDAVAASIKEFGFKVPIVIDAGKVIVAGHTRLQAAKKLKMDVVPCIMADDLTEQQIKAYRLADNRVAELAAWDMEKLNIELEALENIDMTAFGFEEFDDTEDEEPEDIIEDDLPEDVPTRTKPGQLWRLGRHFMLCGDSTKPEDVARIMRGGRADILLTDPPYNVSVGDCERPNSSHNNVHIQNDKMPEDVFIKWLSKALTNANDHMRAGAAFYIFYAGLHHTEFDYALRSVPEFKVHEQLVWVKDHFVLGRNSDYQWQHEPAFYGWKTGATHYFTDSRAEGTVIEDAGVKLSTLKKSELIELCQKLMQRDTASTVLRAEKPSTADLHPTVKPQELICYLLRNSSRKGETVLDLFGGSGSTLIACEQLGRTAHTIEIDPHYADVIIQRYIDFVGTDEEVEQITD